MVTAVLACPGNGQRISLSVLTFLIAAQFDRGILSKSWRVARMGKFQGGFRLEHPVLVSGPAPYLDDQRLYESLN